MGIELLLVQLLVLAFTAALWWIARRDLALRSAPATPAGDAGDPEETRALEQLCVSLEALASDLARRVDILERQAVRAAPPASLMPEAAFDTGAASDLSREREAILTPVPRRAAAPEPAASEADRAVAALLAAGVTDAAEIARRAALSRGEVDLILSLRARQAF